MPISNSSSGTPKPSLNLVQLSDVTPKPVNWLWPGVIPKGKLSLLVGHPGLGKSTLTAAIAAIVSTGRPWPVCDVNADVGEVIFISSEDDLKDTVKPRSIAAGAEDSKIGFIRSVSVGQNRNRPFAIKKDIEKLSQYDIDLLIVDPITSNLAGVEMNNTGEVREVLELLRDYAEEKNVAVLGVSHLNKSEKSENISRVSGSMAFIAVPRVVHLLADDPDCPGRRFLFPLKGNLGPNQDCFAFSIEPRMLEGGIETSAIVWEDECVPAPSDWGVPTKPKSKLEKAKDFLITLLSKKSYQATEVYHLGEKHGHASATLKRAKKELGINPVREGFDGGTWIWSLPTNPSEDAQDAEDAQDSGASLMSTFD